jgi:hypothetical protein
MKKLPELELLKYWIDAEFSILHAMFAIIMLQLVEGVFWVVAFWIYLIIQIIYALVRVAVVASQDKDYLRIPKK